MGFVRDIANAGTFGLAGLALGKDKKKGPVKPVPTMLSNVTLERPTSMIGSTRGGY